MARSSLFNAQPIYDVAAEFLSTCLQGDGSLLGTDYPIWTIENLETFRRVFNLDLDQSDRSFMQKFEEQVKRADSPDIARLAAELLAVYFLFPSNVGQARKRERVAQVLQWAGDEFNSPMLEAAFAQGIGSGGQGYNTRRPFEMAFLVEIALAWKRRPAEERVVAAADPWRFEQMVDCIENAETRQSRHTLLHLLFPDTFERIASGAHKRRVAEEFKSLLDEADADQDVDRRLFAIRARLTELLQSRTPIDFYRSPLKEVWDSENDTDEAGVTAPMEALRHKRQIVLYGPPGTGKTHQAKQIGRRVINSALLAKYKPREFFARKDLNAEIDKRIKRLQLHPAYGYEDFIRGLHIAGNGSTEYRLGYLPRLVAEMRADDDPQIPYVLILDEMNRTDLSRTLGESFSLLENRDEFIDLPGQDSGGNTLRLEIPANLYVIGTMNLIDQSVDQIDFALRRRFLWVACPFSRSALLSAAEHHWTKRVGEGTPKWDRVRGDFERLAGAAEALNREIHKSELLGAQYEIGHAYLLDAVGFLADEIKGQRPNTFLWTGKGEAKRPVQQTWELSLKPLIAEYLAGLDVRTRQTELNRLAGHFLVAPPVGAED